MKMDLEGEKSKRRESTAWERMKPSGLLRVFQGSERVVIAFKGGCAADPRSPAPPSPCFSRSQKGGSEQAQGVLQVVGQDPFTAAARPLSPPHFSFPALVLTLAVLDSPLNCSAPCSTLSPFCPCRQDPLARWVVAG